MTRKTVREALAALFVAEGSFTGGVNAYRPASLGTKTKVLNIYSQGTAEKMESYSNNHGLYTFALDVMVEDERVEGTEDILDTLHEVVRSVVRTNVGNANWDALSLEAPSVASFVKDSGGVPYRLERHSLLVKEAR